jgi:glycosyltransferase involved in cell wall biosynthesis
LQPRKNVGRLVEAFARCRTRTPRLLTLVLAGQVGRGHTGLDTQVAELERQGAVVRPGYVDRADLAALMSGATVFALPSLYEGFGMPILEAMACGTPVVASDTSSLPEVVGDAGLLVNPLDVEAIAAGLQRLLDDAALREALSAKGLQRSREFSWTRCARETLSVLRETAML